jgi:hypothetical protein
MEERFPHRRCGRNQKRVVIWTTRGAGIQISRGEAWRTIAGTWSRDCAHVMRKHPDAVEVDDGVLHGDFDTLATAGLIALEQGGQNAYGTMNTSAGITNGGAWFERPVAWAIMSKLLYSAYGP